MNIYHSIYMKSEILDPIGFIQRKDFFWLCELGGR